MLCSRPSSAPAGLFMRADIRADSRALCYISSAAPRSLQTQNRSRMEWNVLVDKTLQDVAGDDIELVNCSVNGKVDAALRLRMGNSTAGTITGGTADVTMSDSTCAGSVLCKSLVAVESGAKNIICVRGASLHKCVVGSVGTEEYLRVTDCTSKSAGIALSTKQVALVSGCLEVTRLKCGPRSRVLDSQIEMAYMGNLGILIGTRVTKTLDIAAPDKATEQFKFTISESSIAHIHITQNTPKPITSAVVVRNNAPSGIINSGTNFGSVISNSIVGDNMFLGGKVRVGNTKFNVGVIGDITGGNNSISVDGDAVIINKKRKIGSSDVIVVGEKSLSICQLHLYIRESTVSQITCDVLPCKVFVHGDPMQIKKIKEGIEMVHVQ